MILICAKENFNLEDSPELSGLKLTSCPGELKIYIDSKTVSTDYRYKNVDRLLRCSKRFNKTLFIFLFIIII